MTHSFFYSKKEPILNIKKQIAYLVFCLSLCAYANAQQVPIGLQAHHPLSFRLTDHTLIAGKMTLNAFTNCPRIKPQLIKPISINEMPFFCRMECRVRNRANIWLKLRTGNDDSYMKLIGSSSRK